MDNFETESNCSYHSESLLSNASTVSGLSLYGNEFAELRHLVNPSKYPQPYLECSVTPKVELLTSEDDKVKTLRSDLQSSLELNEKYKIEFNNLERKIELKYCDRINQLLRTNSRLEGELENANNQIDRLIKGYKEKHNYKVFKENVDLEKKLHQLNLDCSTLQTKCAKLQQDKIEIELENKNLKISLEELLVERDIRNSSVQSLKQKVSEQHIEILAYMKNNSHLNEKLNLANTKLAESEKSKLWYREQLSICQNDKLKLSEELTKCRSQMSNDYEKILSLNIELSRHKNEVDEVKLQAMKEKEELLKKLESINLDCNNLLYISEKSNNYKNNLDNVHAVDIQFYEQTIEDLKQELSKLNKIILNKSDEIEKLSHENSRVISNCLVLQSTLKQKEDCIHVLETLRKELLQNLQSLKDIEQQKVSEILHLKNKVAELKVELNVRNKEKEDVEASIQLIREQFLKVKDSFEKAKGELNSKTKEVIKLQLEKQELFMNNSRITCEVENLKHKDSLIENLRKENLDLISSLEALKGKLRLAEIQIMQRDETIREKETIVSDCTTKLINQNDILTKYETQISEYEDGIHKLQGELEMVLNNFSELQKAFDRAEVQIDSKGSKINEMLKTMEEQQKKLEIISSEKEYLSRSYTVLEGKYKSDTDNKNKCISDLQNKLKQFETDWHNYLRRITDDQKVELLSSHKNVHYASEMDNSKTLIFSVKNIENYIVNFFDNLNIEEFESSVDVRLKYLDDRIRNIIGNVNYLEEKLKDESGQNKIRELNILLQVKDRELQDRQKKMDRNNRTLLRKVKDHMRGRNSAEKQLKYLQDLYNSLADDKNTIKLSLSSKENEIRSLVEFCEAYKKQIESLRKSVTNLEQALAKTKVCERCIETGQIQEKLVYLEAVCEDLQLRNGCLQEELNFASGNLSSLQEKHEALKVNDESLQQQISALLKENDEIKANAKLRDLERNNLTQVELIKNLENRLLEKEHLCCQQSYLLEKLKGDLMEAAEKTEFLSNEVQIYSSSLQQKVEYSQELEEKITKLEEQSLENDAKYKKGVCLLQNDIKILKNEKFFLQRLSNDLNVVMNTYIEHNKKLKQQLNLFTREKQALRTFPANLLDDISISGKYDENYINRLLNDNRSSSVRTMVTVEIQGCLNKLREEIFSLQDQISKKNGIVHVKDM